MTNLIQYNIHKNLISYVADVVNLGLKFQVHTISLRHINVLKTSKKRRFSAFFRPWSGFRTIASSRVVGSLRNIVENLSLEIALLTMYKSCLFFEIPRRSSIIRDSNRPSTNPLSGKGGDITLFRRNIRWYPVGRAIFLSDNPVIRAT